MVVDRFAIEPQEDGRRERVGVETKKIGGGKIDNALHCSNARMQ